ncbi:hypothetical protein NEOLEDRAFT_149010 [Neolentinus lepideus HHB14362 ss-1]|uniref:Sld7 C-terminal domain-containing protein n=1 Tax=Neolentinus lepideus HHB14362 ss-1 TaxID=1314782 RepID=A0A165MNX9_9AGAM|nr:hypothetical protein NEOLEDRAFT_149010 [Neolentinus lepideus HHB14362 ss-1]
MEKCTTAPSQLSTSTATTDSASPSPFTYRLLYRGALSLPDSHLTLDGLAFLLRHHTAVDKLELENPLALALESLRGRPTLRFLGTSKIRELWLDETASGDVFMYIHPDSFLTIVYFENILCLQPNLSDDGRTEYGVRIGLGDDKSEIIVYGKRSNNAPLLSLCVSRILPGPRLPRPDDPTPRKPPKRSLLSEADGASKKRRKEREDEAVRRAREIMLRGPKAGPSKLPARPAVKGTKSSDAAFKVPCVPAINRSASDPEAKAKGKSKGIEVRNGDEKMPGVERANKTLVKTLTVSHLSFAGMPKDHPEFKEVYEWIYRGVGFALRTHMKTRPVDPRLVDKYVRAHAEMYVSSSVSTKSAEQEQPSRTS